MTSLETKPEGQCWRRVDSLESTLAAETGPRPRGPLYGATAPQNAGNVKAIPQELTEGFRLQHSALLDVTVLGGTQYP